MSVGEAPNPDDYYEYYIDYLRAAGKSERTIQRFISTGEKFQEFLSEEGVNDESNVTPRIAMKFKDFLDTPERNDETIQTYYENVGKMYEYYNNRGEFEANPIWLAADEIEWNISNDTSRVEISMAEMKNAIQNTGHYLRLPLITLLLKTGIRIGEATNLDLRDVHINHRLNDRLLPTPRPEIREDPDTIYIDANVKVGDVVNGRERVEANKRKQSTKIPIDDELKSVLVQWLIARTPTICPADPLFVRLNGSHAGDRHDGDSMKYQVKQWSKNQGWYEKGVGERNNVTAHYFRHFFTTHMRRRVDSEEIGGNDAKYFVKGIRGDSGGDVIDTYTQNWGNYVREAYERNIFKLFQ